MSALSGGVFAVCSHRGKHGGVAERFEVRRDGASLAGMRWPGGDRTVVLLHEGVADSRGWASVAGLLAPEVTVMAYDRRGYGLTLVSTEPFSHVDDLLAVLDALGDGSPVWLMGASAGGGLASGSPAPELDPATQRFDRLLDKACESRNVDEINRLETWLWLDGPAQPEGRVGGAARALALAAAGRPLRTYRGSSCHAPAERATGTQVSSSTVRAAPMMCCSRAAPITPGSRVFRASRSSRCSAGISWSVRCRGAVR